MPSKSFTRLVRPVPATASPSSSRPVKEPGRRPAYDTGRRQPVPMPRPGTGAHLGMYSILPPTPVQTKLTVSTPGDRFETEADRMADTVMTMPEPVLQRQADTEREEDEKATTEAEQIQTKSVAAQITSLVQRQSVNEVEEEADEDTFQAQRVVQRQTATEDEEEETLQPKTGAGTPPVPTKDLQSLIHREQGQGQALPDATRGFFEPRFGHDFSQVRIHADPPAATAARQLHAQAFTRGSDVFFAPGRYQPHTPQGQHLLAHELTHVVQQQAAGPRIQRQATTPVAEEETAPLPETAAQAAAAPAAETETTSLPEAEAPAKEEGLLERAGRVVIEQSLKAAIFAVERMPERLLVLLGPLTPLFKAGAIGFLKRLAREGGSKLLGLLKNAVSAITSPSYILGYIKGFLKGFFIDGLAGIFVFFFDLAKLAIKVVGFGVDLAKALGKVGLGEILSLADEIGKLAVWIGTNGKSLWEAFSAKLVTGGGITGIVAEVLSSLIDKAKNLAKKVGSAIADSLIRFFKQAAGKVGAKLGEIVGRIAGNAAFIILSGVLTGGAGAALAAAKKGLRTILSVLAKAGRGSVAILRRIGSWLGTGFAAVIGWIRALGQTAFFKGLAVRFEMLFVKLKGFVQRLLHALKKKKPGKPRKGETPEAPGVKESIPKAEPKVKRPSRIEEPKVKAPEVKAPKEIQPPLKRIHPEQTIKSGSARFSYDYWRKQSTEAIVESLKPGKPNSLKVKPDGRIFEGNTRILVLEERGFDINSLLRQMIE